MANAVSKIALNGSRDIPFNKLVLSQSNVRRTKAGVSIEDLAEDIARRRKLIQSLSVRPVLDGEGRETGLYEVPAGGRRFRALELLVKQKRMSKTAPVPCVVTAADDAVSAEDDSYAENTFREALHPLDQFRAFQTLSEQGQGEETIAARFFVTPHTVRQRLKLAAVSPKLLDLYAEDGITLDQLMAFSVSGDHARQERVWEALARQPYKEPYQIRRMLTESAVRASDKRARFVGLDAYEQAGGEVSRDLFQHDDGGWLQDVALLDRLVAERLKGEAETVAAEGWRWIEVAPDFLYGHADGLRQLHPIGPALTDKEQATYDALRAEHESLEEQYACSPDDLPEEVDARLGEIEALLDGFNNRPPLFEPAEVSRAGAFVSVDGSGALRVERGFVRPADEAPVEPASVDGREGDANSGAVAGGGTEPVQRAAITVGGAPAPEPAEEDEGVRPIPERLVTELTAHRTLALRDALGQDVEAAFLAALHALALRLFYRFASDRTCLELEPRSSGFGHQAPGLGDTASARSIETRHRAWADQLPKEAAELWDALARFDADSRQALFAHCVGLTVNAVHQLHDSRPGAIAHADQVAAALALDMAEAGWRPTTANYLGRVTKGRILEAVREGKGEGAVSLIDHLKKADMAREAERLLDGTGWLPEPLRTPGLDDGSLPLPSPGAVGGEAATTGADAPSPEADADDLPAFLTADEDASDLPMAAE